MGGRPSIDDETRTRIAAWMRFYQVTRGWTRERLAKELGMAEPSVTNIINLKTPPGLDTLIKMHRRLHRSADDLLDVDPPPAKPPPA